MQLFQYRKAMKKLALLLLFCLPAFYGCNPIKVIDDTRFSTAIEEARAVAEHTFQQNHFPGMAIAVAVKGKIVWSEGFGYADLEKEARIDPFNSKFRVGSISKSFTSAALGRLYDAGRVDMNVPIQNYVPYFPEKKYPVTLKNLAGHVAGIRHYKGSEFLSNRHYETVREGLTIFQDDPLIFKPGQKYAYSSYGWNLISAAIEGASRKDFLSYMNKAVFTPLKMKNSVADNSKKNISNRVRFYQLNDDNEIVDCPVVDNSYKWAGGGFLSTAEDIIKFAHAFSRPGYLSATTLDKWTASQRTTNGKLTNYGIGWRSGTDQFGHSWYGHTGGSVGGTSNMLIYPEHETVVIVLINLSSAQMDEMAYKIGNEFIKAKHLAD